MRVHTLIVPALAVAFAAAAAACSEAGPTEPTFGETGPQVVTVDSETGVADVVRSSSIVTVFPDGAVIAGASAALTRTANGVNLWFQTNGLTSGNAYTLWVVAFNHPAACIVPDECTLDDFFANDPAVAADLINGGGLVAGGSGQGTLAGRVGVEGELGLRGIGLLDAFEPEIHLVVRDHGPKLPGSAQLKEFAGGCEVYACANIQAAARF